MDQTTHRKMTDDPMEAGQASARAFAGLLDVAAGIHLWSRPLGRAQAALDSLSHWIGKGSRLLTEYEFSAPKHHNRSLLRLRAVPDCLVAAAGELEVAQQELDRAMELAGAACRDGGGTLRRLAVVAVRVRRAGVCLQHFSDRMQMIGTTLQEDLIVASAMVAAARAIADARALLAALEPVPMRSFLRFRRVKARSLRTLRTSPLRIADAPRRISRGRAPPSIDLPAPIASKSRKDCYENLYSGTGADRPGFQRCNRP